MVPIVTPPPVLRNKYIPRETKLLKLEGKSPDEPVKPAELRLAAMDFLARREHSRAELLEKLGRRFEKTQLEPVLDALADEGLQSDKRFAESFVRHRALRGYGPVRIRQELRQRGVSDSDVAQAFESNAINWLDILGDVVDRKYDAPPADLKEKARRQRFLKYRGFSHDQIRDVLE